jgi:hypothetical protein
MKRRSPPRDDHRVLMVGIGRAGDEHHVARSGHREREVPDALLRADGEDGLAVGIELDAEAPTVPVADGDAQLVDAARRGVAMVLQLLRRLDRIVLLPGLLGADPERLPLPGPRRSVPLEGEARRESGTPSHHPRDGRRDAVHRAAAHEHHRAHGRARSDGAGTASLLELVVFSAQDEHAHAADGAHAVALLGRSHERRSEPALRGRRHRGSDTAGKPAGSSGSAGTIGVGCAA